MFDFKAIFTHEEILLRFKRLFGRDMTPQEMGSFFFPYELVCDSASHKTFAEKSDPN
jgi:hypothetical protein